MCKGSEVGVHDVVLSVAAVGVMRWGWRGSRAGAQGVHGPGYHPWTLS